VEGPTADIDALRARIDAIDRELVVLLGDRAACALAIGRLKETVAMPVYQPAREAEVLRNVRAANRGPLDDDAIVRLFERIIDEARRLERVAAGVRGAASGADRGRR
jgi:chorismate mutase